MTKRERDETREERIAMEIIVDAYGAEEQAMGWYYYLEDKLHFPFRARCIQPRSISPLHVGDDLILERLAPENECLHDMFVLATWHGRVMGFPLAQLEAMAADEETREAIGDWHYWIERGYGFD